MARVKVKPEPELRDWSAVDDALQDLQECGIRLTELGLAKQRQINAANEEYKNMAEPLQRREKRLRAEVEEFVSAHREDLVGKSKKLIFGTVGYRKGGALILSNSKVKDAIAKLKELGLAAVCIETTEKLKRAELKKQPQEVLDAVGARLGDEDEFFIDLPDAGRTEQ